MRSKALIFLMLFVLACAPAKPPVSQEATEPAMVGSVRSDSVY